MPAHLFAYTGTLTGPGTFPLAGIVDNVLTRSASSGNYIFQFPWRLKWAFGLGETLTRVQITSPTLRQVQPPYIRPIQDALNPPDVQQIQWFGDQPLDLPAFEEFSVQATLTAGPELDIALFSAFTDEMQIPAGRVLTSRWTAAIATVAGQWTLGTMQADQSLPPGTYAIVGLEVISATGLAARLQIPNQVFRPRNDMQHRRAGSTGLAIEPAPTRCVREFC